MSYLSMEKRGTLVLFLRGTNCDSGLLLKSPVESASWKQLLVQDRTCSSGNGCLEQARGSVRVIGGSIVVVTEMHRSALLLRETDNPSSCASGLTTPLMPRACFSGAVPSHHGKGTKTGSFHEWQDSSKNNYVSRTPHRLEIVLENLL